MAFLAAALLAIAPAYGKPLAGRIGVGFNTQLATVFSGPGSIATTTTQALSGKYWFTNDVGVQVLVGFNTWRLDRQTNYDVGTGAKFLYNLIQEENLNFFLDAGAGLLFVGHEDDSGRLKNDLGFSVLTGIGIEWFFQGLPNLGFDAEVGVQYSYVGEYTRIGSFGDAFGTFGVHYYF
jgi:hypothetical protein